MGTASTAWRRSPIAPRAPKALTSDELRAIARLAGATLPATLTGYDAADDDPAFDAVAVRSLLARGVVAFAAAAAAGRAGPAPELTLAARAVLDPLLVATTLVELDRESPAGTERHVLATSADGRLLLSEADTDVWVLAPGGDLDDVLAEVHAELAAASGGLSAELPPPVSVTISATDHEHVETLIAAGLADEVAAALVDAGVDDSPAAALAKALTSRASETAVHRAARLDDGGYAATDTCWFDAGPHGWWLVAPANEPEGPDELDDDLALDDDADPETVSTFHRTTPAAIGAVLDAMLAGSLTPTGGT